MAKRRENGEGTVTKRRDGRWQAAYYVALGDGTRKRRFLYAPTRDLAREKLRAALVAGDRGETPTDRRAERATVGWWLGQWLALKEGEVAGTTWREYDRTIRLHLLPALGGLRLTALRPSHVRRLLGEKAVAGLSPQTRRHIYNRLNSALKDAVVEGLVTSNVMDRVSAPRVPPRMPETFTRDELQTILVEAGRHQVAADGLCVCRGYGCRRRAYYRLFVFAVQTGLRVSELQALQWNDVDFETERLHVRRSMRRDRSLAEPKSAAGRRMVPIPDSADLLLEHRRAQAEDRLAVRSWYDHDLVFCTREGRPLSYRTIHRVFAETQLAAGIPAKNRRGLHALRKFYGTALVSSGAPVNATQRMMGHSRSELTLAYYVAVDDGLLDDAARRASGTFRSLVEDATG